MPDNHYLMHINERKGTMRIVYVFNTTSETNIIKLLHEVHVSSETLQ